MMIYRPSPRKKNGYQCFDWQGIRRERTTPCVENGESEFRGYDNIHDAKRDIKKLVDGNGKIKNPANPNSANSSSANAGRTSPAADELSPEEENADVMPGRSLSRWLASSASLQK